MRTRSQTLTQNPPFDFDEASREWRKNKTHIGQGHFIYKTVVVDVVATASHHSYNLRSREKKPVTPFKPPPPQ